MTRSAHHRRHSLEALPVMSREVGDRRLDSVAVTTCASVVRRREPVEHEVEAPIWVELADDS